MPVENSSLYAGIQLLLGPVTDHIPRAEERNREIHERYEAGETAVQLAEAFDISEQRVYVILRNYRRENGLGKLGRRRG